MKDKAVFIEFLKVMVYADLANAVSTYYATSLIKLVQGTTSTITSTLIVDWFRLLTLIALTKYFIIIFCFDYNFFFFLMTQKSVYFKIYKILFALLHESISMGLISLNWKQRYIILFGS